MLVVCSRLKTLRACMLFAGRVREDKLSYLCRSGAGDFQVDAIDARRGQCFEIAAPP
jgi:hypothetical protein